MRILFLGDIVGKPGREAVKAILPRLVEEHNPDFVLTNAENIADSTGVNLASIGNLTTRAAITSGGAGGQR